MKGKVMKFYGKNWYWNFLKRYGLKDDFEIPNEQKAKKIFKLATKDVKPPPKEQL